MSIQNHKEFLKSIAEYSSGFSSIKEGDELVSLSLNFWSWEEISGSLLLREDWHITDNLIPFYGDWHDLYCIDLKSDKIFYLNDAREKVCEWNNPTEFKNSLSKEIIEPKNIKGIVSGKLEF